jgi:hypothetical protein
MGHMILSVAEAKQAARQADQYILWVKEQQARLFREPGWVKLEPPRDGAVLFIHPEREVRAIRAREIL